MVPAERLRGNPQATQIGQMEANRGPLVPRGPQRERLYISKEHCSISYISIDDVANTVLQLGRGSLLAKADIQEAFRIIPVAPTDRLLLATQWKDELFLDKVLPFGLRSAPIIFTAVADALEWVIRRQGVPHIFHYVDDYILVGKPNSPNCGTYLSTLLQTCTSLGVPMGRMHYY